MQNFNPPVIAGAPAGALFAATYALATTQPTLQPTLQPDEGSGVGPARDRRAGAADGARPRPSMLISEEVRTLLDVPVANDGAADFAASATTGSTALALHSASTESVTQSTRPSLAPQERADLLSHGPMQYLRQYVALWHSAAMHLLPERDAVLKEWTTAVLRDLRAAGVRQTSVDRMERAFDAMRIASDLLGIRMATALQRLATPQTAARLETAGLTVNGVRGALYRYANDILRTLEREAVHGTPVFNLVPQPASLLESAIQYERQLRRDQLADRPGYHGRVPADVHATPLPEPSTSTPQQAPVETLRPVAGGGAITTRAQALRELQSFETGRRDRLGQLAGTAGDAVRLAMGFVHFADMRDLVATYPCARIQPARRPPGQGALAEGAVFAPGYAYIDQPAAEPLATPHRAYVCGTQTVVARSRQHPNTIRYSTDFLQWHATDVYTDDVVEGEKKAMWNRIFREAFRRSIGIDSDPEPSAPAFVYLPGAQREQVPA